MEIVWLVLLIIVPLFAGAIFMLYRQTQSAGPGPQAADRRTDSRAVEDRRRLPRGFGPMGLLLGATVAGAVVAAIVIGFPILRAMLIAFNAPVDAE